MPRIVEPKVFLLAETGLVHFTHPPAIDVPKNRVDERGYFEFLKQLGVPDWHTEAHSPAEELIEVAGKTCYMSFDTSLNKNLTKTGTRDNHDYIQKGIIGTKHGSVLEHASVTLAFVDVSRVFTHELVRHRAGCSYSQVSGRYVRTDEIGYFLPKVIRENVEAEKMFDWFFGMMEHTVKRLEAIYGIDGMKDFDLKKKLTSAFRRLFGNGQSNHIIGTFNHRALRNIIELRTSRHAEEEIRVVFAQVYSIVANRYPALYDDAQVEVIDDYPEIVFRAAKV